MDTALFGYILGSIILIAFVYLKIREYRQKKLDQPIQPELENMIKNGFILRELTNTYNTLREYTQFLENVIGRRIPEVAQEVSNIQQRMRFTRDLISILQGYPSDTELTNDEWETILKTVATMNTIRRERGPITEQDILNQNKQIDELINKGHLPKDFPKPTGTSSLRK